MKNISLKSHLTLLAIAVAGLLSNHTKAQIFVSLGYNAMVPFQVKDLNGIIKKYNNENPEQSKEMGRFFFLHGLNYKAGGYIDNWCIDGGYTGARMKHKSLGPTNRELRLSFWAVQFSLGKTNDPKSENNRTFGALLDLGQVKVKSRASVVSGTKGQDWLPLVQSFYTTIGAFARYNFGDPGVSIEAYFKINPVRAMHASVKRVNKELREVKAATETGTPAIGGGGLGVKVNFYISSN